MIVTLDWNANTEPDLASYRVYSGRSAGAYSGYTQVASNVLTAQLTLPDGREAYIAMTAVDNESNESDFSEELVEINKYTKLKVA